MTAADPDLMTFAVHARKVAVGERQRFADRVRQIASDGLLLETCHRVEWIGRDGLAAAALAEALPSGGTHLVGEEAARHAIEVAVGLDSIVVGEDQVLHQLRRAVGSARGGGSIDATVDRVLTLALRAGRRARSWRQGPARSLADTAVTELQRRIGSLRGQPVLVVGSGDMGRLAAGAVSRAGARIHIASRSASRAETLASAVGGTAVAFDPGAEASAFAGILVALRGAWTLSATSTASLAAGRAVVVDLSVPPALDPALADRLDDRFIGIDAFAELDDVDDRRAHDSMARERALVESTLDEFRGWLESRGRRTVAAALAARAEHDRRTELDDLWRRLPGLGPDERGAIERMSRHLVGRLLHEPVERLGQDTDGRYERSIRELWAL